VCLYEWSVCLSVCLSVCTVQVWCVSVRVKCRVCLSVCLYRTSVTRVVAVIMNIINHIS